MKILALVAAAVAALMLAVPTLAASRLTKDQAYKRARACLLKNGAGFVARRGDGGGFATFTRSRGSTYWTYGTLLSQVDNVTVYFAGRPGPDKALRAQTKKCLTDGI